MTPIRMLSADDKLAEIRRLYFKTSRQTIQEDLAKEIARVLAANATKLSVDACLNRRRRYQTSRSSHYPRCIGSARNAGSAREHCRRSSILQSDS